MNFINFESLEAQELQQEILENLMTDADIIDSVYLEKDGDDLVYDCQGRTRCWICTAKHFGSAIATSVELHRYPHYFFRVIGDLYQAYSECPSRRGRSILEELYTTCVDTGKVPDLTEPSKELYKLYKKAIG